MSDEALDPEALPWAGYADRLVSLPPPELKVPSPHRNRTSGKAAKRKGSSGEREVVDLWKTNGWPSAFRTPGSGAWRPYGAKDQAPFPLDVASGWPEGWPQDRRVPWAGPWMVEVKREEAIARPGRHWVGEAFVRSVVKGVVQQHARYMQTAGAHLVRPAIFARANGVPWRVFVPESVFCEAFGSATRSVSSWVELDTGLFFAFVARLGL